MVDATLKGLVKIEKKILIETIFHKYTTFNIYNIKKIQSIYILHKGEVCPLNGAE